MLKSFVNGPSFRLSGMTEGVVSCQEGEVGDGEGVRPVMVGRVPVAPPHHQHEPRQGLAGYPKPEPNRHCTVRISSCENNDLTDRETNLSMNPIRCIRESITAGVSSCGMIRGEKLQKNYFSDMIINGKLQLNLT